MPRRVARVLQTQDPTSPSVAQVTPQTPPLLPSVGSSNAASPAPKPKIPGLSGLINGLGPNDAPKVTVTGVPPADRKSSHI